MDVYELIISILFLLWGLSELILIYTRRAKRVIKKINDWTLWVQCVGVFISVLLGLTWRSYDEIRPSGIFFTGNNREMFFVAVFLLLVGLVIRWHAILQLKQWFSTTITIQEGQQVLSDGIYKFIRHPSYSGVMLCFLAVALSFHTFFLFLVVFLPNLLAMLIRISFEEKILIEHFGKEYIEYKQHSKKLIPWLF